MRIAPRRIKSVCLQLISEKDAEIRNQPAFSLRVCGETHSGSDLRRKIRRQRRIENKSPCTVNQKTAQRL
jgi:hypothetical protein